MLNVVRNCFSCPCCLYQGHDRWLCSRYNVGISYLLRETLCYYESGFDVVDFDFVIDFD